MAPNMPITDTKYDQSTFTGSDIKAIIVRRDDPVLLKNTINYLQSIQVPATNIPGTPGAINPYPISGPLGAAGDSFGPPYGNKVDIGTMLPITNDAYDYIPYAKSNLVPLINLQTITISTFRSKQQVRALGQVNPRGIARGTRTIAGTMILAEFDKDAFWELILGNPLNTIPAGDNNIGDAGEAVLPDQVAAFNLLLLFSNEMGFNSYRMIYEIELVTNGIVYSIQDMYHENTVSFMCTDVTPLTPLNNLKGNTLNASISPLSAVTTGKELVKRYRLLKNSRNTSF
jgi:hypothetical protein